MKLADPDLRLGERQLDLFSARGLGAPLDHELWRRRQDRRDATIGGEGAGDAMLLPLVLALARLGAQRDARAVAAATSRRED